MHEFFLMMLGALDQDVPGIIRRFSQILMLRFGEIPLPPTSKPGKASGTFAGNR